MAFKNLAQPPILCAKINLAMVNCARSYLRPLTSQQEALEWQSPPARVLVSTAFRRSSASRGYLFEMKMDKQRWHQIETLYHPALERATDGRAAILADACADDSGLRREVEELLRYDSTEVSFMVDNALDVAAQALESNELSQTDPQLFPGQVIGAYKILGLLGRGG